MKYDDPKLTVGISVTNGEYGIELRSDHGDTTCVAMTLTPSTARFIGQQLLTFAHVLEESNKSPPPDQPQDQNADNMYLNPED